MRIWVDADACPKAIKDILYRAAIRTETKLIFVSGQAITIIPSPFVSRIQVMSGPDAADNKIIDSVETGDLVITADIPLADAVVSKECVVLNPRGTLYSKHNIKERLAIRNLSHDLRSSGVKTTGPDTLTKQEIQRFSNQLDKTLQCQR